MKVEYIQCDICGEKILENDPYYKLDSTAKRECCNYNGHTLEICESCAHALSTVFINRNKKPIFLSWILFTNKE